MFRKTMMALAAAASLGFTAAPALANYDYCVENPSAKGCPGDFNVKDEPFHIAQSNAGGAYAGPSHKAAEHQSSHPTYHHG